MDVPVNRIATEIDSNEDLEIQRETFVASLSHDLKNPTIAQIRALELVLKGNFGQVLPQQREIMEMVLDSCKYMYSMLMSVLETYRIDRGTIKLANDEVSIYDLAQECADEMLYLAKHKDIYISLKNSAKNSIVYGDRVQLKRVIMNLLSNSIKYAYKNSNLFIEVYNEGDNTCFKFQNSSPYLNKEKREKIFAKYVTYSQSSVVNGIGLGLYASKKIVEAHGGIMFVESFEDNRNIFGFKIPNDEKTKFVQKSVTF